MRFSSVLLLALLAVTVSGGLGHRSGHRSSSCTYWCKTRTYRFYCCNDRLGPTRRPHHHSHVRDQSHPHHGHHSHQPRPGSHHTVPSWPIRPSFGKLPSAGGHRSSCPPPRPFCPRIVHQASAPQVCKGDFSCGHADKCCYDACLKLKVCKPAQ